MSFNVLISSSVSTVRQIVIIIGWMQASCFLPASHLYANLSLTFLSTHSNTDLLIHPSTREQTNSFQNGQALP